MRRRGRRRAILAGFICLGVLVITAEVTLHLRGRALRRLGDYYVDAGREAAWNETAADWYRAAAKAGDARAARKLAMMIRKRPGPQSLNNDEAMTLLRMAAAAGDPEEMVKLGVEIAYGRTSSRGTAEIAEAVKLFRASADAGNTKGMIELGEMYLRGYGVEKDVVAAREWFKKAVDAGDVRGMIALGESETDESTKYEWFLRAALTGDADAMYDLGKRYRESTHFLIDRELDATRGGPAKPRIEQDDKEAEKWLTKAAEVGHTGAMVYLGRFYFEGERDQRVKAIWVLRPGTVEYDSIHRATKVNSQDYSKAVKWFGKAALAGSPWGMVRLGDCYRDGLGVGKDEMEAAKYYRQAIAVGHTQGMVRMGELCQDKQQDFAQALQWFRKAADAGDGMGAYHVGRYHRDGIVVKPDPGEALKWFRQAMDNTASYSDGYLDMNFYLRLRDSISQLEAATQPQP